jgi:hypothetical protein
MKPLTLATVEAQLWTALEAGDSSEIDRLAALLDRLDYDQARQPQLLPSALWYAAQGLHVFPLQPLYKVPWPRSRGFKDATTDPLQIHQWWDSMPTANVGIATGHRVDVIDVDGPEGVKSWLDTHDLPPLLGQVSTPRPGGHHLYVPANPSRGNKAGLLPGVDYRGLGGYVVAPPSSTEVGTYEWFRPLDLEGAPA